MGNAVARLAFHYSFRGGKLVVEPHERFAVCIESVYRCIDAVEGVVVATFLVFRLVVDDGPVHFHLSRGEVALEVLHVRSGIPQAPFGEGEQFESSHFGRSVPQGQLLHLSPDFQWDEEEQAGLNAVFGSGDAGIAHSMTALVAIEGCLAGLPCRRPYAAAFVDVEVASPVVHRHAVVAVAGDTAELGILVEGVASGGIGDEREEIFIAQVVNPRPGCLGVGNDVFAVFVIEISESFVLHIIFVFGLIHFR